MNVPQVYYWSVGMTPPKWEERDPTIDSFRFRTGVWFCGRGACVLDREVSVTIVFTLPNAVSEHVVTELMFDYLWRDEDFDQPREDEEGICWTFSRLYYLITDWQNILGEVLARLGEAEANSHGRHLPVKTRTRRMHMEVDRIYEMKKFLRFHMRAFSKLQKLKLDVPKDEQQDPLWDDMDDAIEDLEQFDSTLDGLKDRESGPFDIPRHALTSSRLQQSHRTRIQHHQRRPIRKLRLPLRGRNPLPPSLLPRLPLRHHHHHVAGQLLPLGGHSSVPRQRSFHHHLPLGEKEDESDLVSERRSKIETQTGSVHDAGQ